MGLRGAPRDGDGVRKYSPSCGVGRGWGKIKPCGAGMQTLSFGPALPHCHPYSLSLPSPPCLRKLLKITLQSSPRSLRLTFQSSLSISLVLAIDLVASFSTTCRRHSQPSPPTFKSFLIGLWV